MALARLEKEGLVRRLARSGAFIGPAARAAPPPPAGRAIECLTFIRRPYTTTGSLREAIVNSLLEGYTEALDRCGAKMRFVSWSEGTQPSARLFAPGLPLGRQGCVLVDVLDGGLMAWLRKHGIAFAVQYFTNYSSRGLPAHSAAFPDKVQGVYEAARHLIGLGHTRIGFMGPVRIQRGDRSLYGVHGYKAAMIWAGLDAPRGLLIDVQTEEGADGLEPARKLLAGPGRPTAMLAQTDGQALALLDLARSMRLKVPEDLSIVGFNDQPGVAFSTPPLTTVATPWREQGRTVVEMVLAAAARGHDPCERRALSCRLVVRGSTAAISPKASNSRTGNK